MLLERPDAELFFRLHSSMMHFVNQRLKVLRSQPATIDDFAALPPAERLKIRDALNANLDLIGPFVADNPAGLSDHDLDIVRSWRHQVTGRFCVLSELKKYTVFLTVDEPAIAYGVLALAHPFEDLIGPNRPVMVQAVLLPFKGMVVIDGLMTQYRVSFGPGIRRSLNERFKDAKARHGLVTALPMSDVPLPQKAPKARSVSLPPSREEKDEALGVILGLIEPFCKEHLNEEYAVLCRKLAGKLARKRPSPLLYGSPNAWASGIVRTVGGVNFLHDKSQTPYMRSTDIDHYLGTSPSNGATKLAAIRKMLKIYPLDPNWTLPGRMDNNPLVWTLQVNGIMMDIRRAPREVREMAFSKGLIPYIPADHKEGE